MKTNASTLVFWLTLILIFSCVDLVYGFPVLYGDDYTITVQFEGEEAQVVSPIYDWGVGNTDSGGHYTVTDYEAFWPIGSQDGYVVWRTFSSNLEDGIGYDVVPNSHAVIRAQVSHATATYADFTVSGLDGWVDYPGLASLNNFQPDFDSIETQSMGALSNFVFTGTTISFRSPSDPYLPVEFNLGFRGEPIPEPATLLLLGLGGLVLRKRKA